MQIYIDPNDKPKSAHVLQKSTAHPKASSKKNKKKARRRVSLFTRMLNWFFLILVWGGMSITLVLAWFTQGLPDLSALSVNTRRPSVTIQTQDGTILGSYGDVYEDMLLTSELPDYVPKALMAVEDRRFETHPGIDFMGLMRAFIANYRAGHVVQGGSTLTQQLAKNILETHGVVKIGERSMKRKIQEVIIALWLEWRFTKPQIMTMYLNRVCFGGTIYGVDAAAHVYFNKSARNLSVFEAALIAGLLKAPSRYSPVSHPKKAIERATVVLKLMEEAGFIQDYKHYVKQGEIELAQIHVNQGKGGKYFADWVYETLPSYIGPINKDIIVTTTLDTALQRHGELVSKHYNETMGKELKASQIAFVAMSPDGAVRAMIGGRNYDESQFNRVTAQRQPGSAFKVFIYLAAMEAGLSPETMIDDSPIVIGHWKPSNFKYISQGEISLHDAFMKSVNSVSIRLLLQVGIDTVADTAERLGLSHCSRIGPSIALGTTETTLLDLTASFAAFAHQGHRTIPYGVIEVRDKEGNILYQQNDAESEKVISDIPLQKMRSLLRSVVASGSGRAANIDETMSGKTGSNGDRDAWFIFYREHPNENAKGFTELVGGVWVGNDDNAPMAKISTGGRMPTRVARAILEGPNRALIDLAPSSLENENDDGAMDLNSDQKKRQTMQAPAEKKMPQKKNQETMTKTPDQQMDDFFDMLR